MHVNRLAMRDAPETASPIFLSFARMQLETIGLHEPRRHLGSASFKNILSSKAA